MFNEKKFRMALIENGLKIDDIAKALKVSKTTIYRKIKGESDFFRSEIQTIAEMVGKENANQIFFAN